MTASGVRARPQVLGALSAGKFLREGVGADRLRPGFLFRPVSMTLRAGCRWPQDARVPFKRNHPLAPAVASGRGFVWAGTGQASGH